MPLDTGIAVTSFLTLSLRASISRGCRNTDLLQAGGTRPTSVGTAEAQATPCAGPAAAGLRAVRRRSVAAPSASPATANATTTARSDHTEPSTPPKPVLVVVATAVIASTA